MPEWKENASPQANLGEAAVLDLNGTGSEDESRELPRRRRIRLPLILFLLTCFSAFWVATYRFWPPAPWSFDAMEMRRTAYSHWHLGVVYMLAMIGILFSHEMGHFLATVRYRIPASLPFFLPCPFTPVGTFGAVIGMDGMRADRKQIFDIGIAGPLAGLVIAVPVCWYGLSQIDFTAPTYGPIALDMPLAMRWALNVMQPDGYDPSTHSGLIEYSQINPCLMAGWVGLLVTGLNMVPIGQFDGGHVSYTIFGRRLAHFLARAFLVLTIAYTVYADNQSLILMVSLFLLVGPDHPPTRDDSVPIGWFRWFLGLVSLSIPVLCLAPRIVVLRGMM